MRFCALILILTGAALAQEAPGGLLNSGEATLFDRFKHKHRGRATFSFEHGIRDDPHSLITRNDWDLQFNGGQFYVNMAKDDRSRIVDLGAKKFSEITELPAAAAEDCKRVRAVEGHLYLVHTKDTDTDQIALFRVRRSIAGDLVEIEWARFARDPDKHNPAMTASTRARLSKVLAGAHDSIRKHLQRKIGVLSDPEAIRLQIWRGGTSGAHSRVALNRAVFPMRDEPAPDPLDFRKPPTIRDSTTWYWKGGYLPDDKALVVDVVDVFVQAAGNSNGNGKALVVVAGQRVLNMHNLPGPYRIWFEGRAVIRPREEDKLFAEVANSSALDVRVIGHLIPLADADKVQVRRFVPRRAPSGIERVGRGVVTPLRWVLDRPHVVLQIRGGAEGGHTRWIDMLGGSDRVDATDAAPLALDKPIEMGDRCIAFCDGGRIPVGKMFVVTRVEYRGSAKGDADGPGAMYVRVRGTVIVNEQRSAKPIQGVWTGEIKLFRGEEKRVRVQIANSSFADVKITGRFVDIPD